MKTLQKGKKIAESICKGSMSQRKRIGGNSQFSSDRLLDKLGFMEEMFKVDAILRNDYNFPEDCSERTYSVCREGRNNYHKTVEKTIMTFVLRKDFEN